MHRYWFLFLFLPFTSLAQTNMMYLSKQNQITATRSDYVCQKNEQLSKGYSSCYDCFDDAQQLVKQLNTQLHITNTVIENDNKPFVGISKEQGVFLLGEYKNGKPYNGFFKHKTKSGEWLIYDFYKNGQRISQVLNDLYKTMKAEKDDQVTATTLDVKNTFTNGVLENGLAIIPASVKGGVAEIVQYVRHQKTTVFTIGLFAVHYGEFINVSSIENGYLIESFARNSVRITFHANGRKIESFDRNGKLENTVNFSHYAFSQQDAVDQERSFSYLRKNHQLYIEQATDTAQLAAFQELARGDDGNSSVVSQMAHSFYRNYSSLEAKDLQYFIANMYFNDDDFLGACENWDGKAYGMVYKKGTKEGTYTLTMYEEGKVVTQPELKATDQTVDEIAAALKAIRQKQAITEEDGE